MERGVIVSSYWFLSNTIPLSLCFTPAPVQVVHGLQFCQKLAPPWASMGCRTTFFTLVFSAGCRGIPALSLGVPPSPLSSPVLVCTGLFLTHFSHPLPDAFLRMLSQMYHKHCWWTQLCSAVGQSDLVRNSWSQLCLAKSSSYLFSQRPPLHHCYCQHLGT